MVARKQVRTSGTHRTLTDGSSTLIRTSSVRSCGHWRPSKAGSVSLSEQLILLIRQGIRCSTLHVSSTASFTTAHTTTSYAAGCRRPPMIYWIRKRRSWILPSHTSSAAMRVSPVHSNACSTHRPATTVQHFLIPTARLTPSTKTCSSLCIQMHSIFRSGPCLRSPSPEWLHTSRTMKSFRIH